MDGADEGEAKTEEKRRARVRDRARRVISTNVLAGVLIVLGVLTATQGYVLSEQNKALALCQQAYSNGFADALDARSEANGEAQKALDDWMTAVGEVMTSTDRVAAGQNLRKATAEYLTKRLEARRAQEMHPYPDAPRDACKHLRGG